MERTQAEAVASIAIASNFLRGFFVFDWVVTLPRSRVYPPSFYFPKKIPCGENASVLMANAGCLRDFVWNIRKILWLARESQPSYPRAMGTWKDPYSNTAFPHYKLKCTHLMHNVLQL
jgi:hypothetical protein